MTKLIKEKIMSENFLKIETYIPEMALENVKNGLYKYGFGKIGNYDCCMSWHKVESSWRPNDKAKPFLGE